MGRSTFRKSIACIGVVSVKRESAAAKTQSVEARAPAAEAMCETCMQMCNEGGERNDSAAQQRAASGDGGDASWMCFRHVIGRAQYRVEME